MSLTMPPPVLFPVKKSMSEKKYFVHESSYIDEPCQIGDGTKIWHFCHILKDAVIGKDCNIGQNVVVLSGVEIGNGVKIQNNVTLSDGCKCEDNVFIGPSVVFTNVINPRSHIVRKNEYMKTLVKTGATLGANSTIICGHTIGRYAFVAAGSVVATDIPDFGLVAGNPARLVGHFCKCGNRISFDGDKATCGACGLEYVKGGDGKVSEK